MSAYLSKEYLMMLEEMKRAKAERQRLAEIAHILKIPVVYSPSGDAMVQMKDLWPTLQDEKKFKELVAIIRNKAFW